MNNILKLLIVSVLLAGFTGNLAAAQDHHNNGRITGSTTLYELADEHEDSEGHDKHGSNQYDEIENTVKLSSTAIELANIKVSTLRLRTMAYQVYAPGEIKANAYTSYLVSPRVDSVVLRRHAALGDYVEKGQALVTLFSEVVAEAQAGFLVASSEWQRVKNLGQKAVGARRFITGQMDYETAYAKLLAFGLSENAIQELVEKFQALGGYTLTAAIAGVVLSDDFHQGQRVAAGKTLMNLADEQELWIEARLAPNTGLNLPAGTRAQVKVGNELFTAKVTQEAHTIDPVTRTRVVRLLVNNDAHRLHSGMFVDVYFLFDTDTPVLAVPEAALVRSTDGDWTVFVEDEPGQFKAQEVELGRALGKWREIKGLGSVSRVVTEGAFFVASQIARDRFDPHNH